MQTRPYEKRDRAAIRELACATADCGKPLDWLIPDRVFLADLLTRYYTDFEPESSWVAEVSGRVAGYLNGCRDSRTWSRQMAWRIVPTALMIAFCRGLVLRPEIQRLLRLNWQEQATRRLGDAPWLKEYPAHLHVNVSSGARGRGLGTGLIAKFLETLCLSGVPGVHVSVRADNGPGLVFFQSHGFEEFARVPGLRVRGCEKWTSVILTRRVDRETGFL